MRAWLLCLVVLAALATVSLAKHRALRYDEVAKSNGSKKVRACGIHLLKLISSNLHTPCPQDDYNWYDTYIGEPVTKIVEQCCVKSCTLRQLKKVLCLAKYMEESDSEIVKPY